MAHKKLYKSETDKVLAGVIGGLGEHFDVDSTLLRLAWLLIVIFSGIFPGVILYILAAFIMPKKQGGRSPHKSSSESDNGEYTKIV